MTEEPKIIYEDENFLAVNKPAGLLVHGARQQATSGKKQEPTLVDWLLKKYPEIKNVGDNPELRPGIVHRLDKDTSGMMLVAKTQEYFDYLKSLFQKREIKKTYLAAVMGKVEPKTGEINKPIGIRNGTLKRSVHSGKMVKEAVTEYKVLKYVTCNRQQATPSGKRRAQNAACYMLHVPCTLLEVYPETGRTHQIRVHLASIGHPVLGDKLYGGKRFMTNDSRLMTDDTRNTTGLTTNKELFATNNSHQSSVRSQKSEPRLMLHALSVEFTDKKGRRIKIEAEPPDELVSWIAG